MMHDDHEHHEGHDHDKDHKGHKQNSHDHGLGGQKEKSVLEFVLEHNKQHTEELVGLAEKLEQAGKTEAAALLRAASSDYESGNAKLHSALHKL